VDNLICALTDCFDASVGNMLLPAWRSSPITDVELLLAKRAVR
jgi:hypothetical protein